MCCIFHIYVWKRISTALLVHIITHSYSACGAASSSNGRGVTISIVVAVCCSAHEKRITDDNHRDRTLVVNKVHHQLQLGKDIAHCNTICTNLLWCETIFELLSDGAENNIQISRISFYRIPKTHRIGDAEQLSRTRGSVSSNQFRAMITPFWVQF